MWKREHPIGDIRIDQLANIDASVDKFRALPADHFDHADSVYRNLAREISEFQSSLDNEHEVGVLLVGFSREVLMRVTRIAHQKPNLL